MRLIQAFSVIALTLSLAVPALALQVEELTVTSPITGQTFSISAIGQGSKAGEGPTDLGEDEDGCRHTAGTSEYDLYLACDPYSYFTCLTAEYDARTGRLKEDLPPEVTDWVLKDLGRDYNLSIDRAQAYTVLKRRTAGTGQATPTREAYAMSQADIPVVKRYQLAIECYRKRQARNDVLGRIAQAGAWAVRSRLNKPLADPGLDGGYEEVSSRIARDLKPGERFDAEVWLKRYTELFAGGTLTNEGYFICGNALIGLNLRVGDLKAAEDALGKMRERFSGDDVGKSTLVRMLCTERQRSLQEYVRFSKLATGFFLGAVAEEYYPRSRLHIYLFTIAEGLRRVGEAERSANWYYALSRMPETQPRLRDEIRTQGKAPGLSAPIAVQLGWKADLALARIAEGGTPIPTELGGPDKALLQAIVFEGLGTAAYRNPNWIPHSKGGLAECANTLTLVGQSLIDWSFRKGGWPENLDALWENGVLVDRNRVNRFCDPASGERLLYTQPKGELEQTNPRAVLVALPRPVATPDGPKYGAYLANNSIIWRDQILKPGTVARE